MPADGTGALGRGTPRRPFESAARSWVSLHGAPTTLQITIVIPATTNTEPPTTVHQRRRPRPEHESALNLSRLPLGQVVRRGDTRVQSCVKRLLFAVSAWTDALFPEIQLESPWSC